MYKCNLILEIAQRITSIEKATPKSGLLNFIPRWLKKW